MEDSILQRAKELFGEDRFEEIMGELWLQRERLATRAAAGNLDAVLREWENRFRCDVEEGRHRAGRGAAGGRRRDARFSELRNEVDESGDGATVEDLLTPHVRRRF